MFENREVLKNQLLAGGVSFVLSLSLAETVTVDFASAATPKGGISTEQTGGVSASDANHKDPGGIPSGSRHGHHHRQGSGGYPAAHDSSGGISAN